MPEEQAEQTQGDEQIILDMPEANGMGIEDEPEQEVPEQEEEQSNEDELEDDAESEDESEEAEDESEQPEWADTFRDADDMYARIKELEQLENDKLAEQQALELAQEDPVPELTPEEMDSLSEQFMDATLDPKQRLEAISSLVNGMLENKLNTAVEQAVARKTAPLSNFMAKQQLGELTEYAEAEVGKKYSGEVVREANKLLLANPHRRQELNYFKNAIDQVLGQKKYRQVAAERLFDKTRSEKSKARKTSTPKGRAQAPKPPKNAQQAIIDSIMGAGGEFGIS